MRISLAKWVAENYMLITMLSIVQSLVCREGAQEKQRELSVF